uniref:Natural cytotoxicity triggering receptor 3 n=1 Tax=Pelusios castaneus TaxID=367368 RepID=A0A8C8RPS2_9SAUR
MAKCCLLLSAYETRVNWTLGLNSGEPLGSWAQDLWVSQPSFVQGTEGSSIILPCSYNSSRVPRLGSYLWVKEVEGARLEVSNGTQEFRGRVSRALDRSFLQERRADVEIRELRLYDSGTYRCLVKIPSLGEGVGNGTWLRVVKAGELWGKKVNERAGRTSA